MRMKLLYITLAFILVGCGTASDLVGKTLDADNIINTYEWYFDVGAAFDAKVNQIEQHNEDYQLEEDPKERRLLRTELRSMQQVCRDLAERYNANSEKLNRSLFKDWSLPATLNEMECECND